jgi:myo-inositol-1(or 4)-monophosphatase
MWVIDPLDGTNNYAHRFPFFAVSVALYRNRRPQLAVIYNPLHDEMYHAEKDAGAYCNDEKIAVSKVSDLQQSLLATGFYYERGDVMDRTLEQIRAFLTNPINGVRRAGSACMDLCNVAAGRVDGYWELKLGPWDYAGGVLLVTEAGGKVSNVEGGEYDLAQENILVSNGLLHEQMLEVIRR